MVAVASPLSPGGGGGGRRKGRKEGGKVNIRQEGEWSGGGVRCPLLVHRRHGGGRLLKLMSPPLPPPRPRLLHERKGCVITSLGPSSQMYSIFLKKKPKRKCLCNFVVLDISRCRCNISLKDCCRKEEGKQGM